MGLGRVINSTRRQLVGGRPGSAITLSHTGDTGDYRFQSAFVGPGVDERGEPVDTTIRA